MAKVFDIRGKTVFVAGGSGLVGRALVEELSNVGCTVLSPTRLEVDLSSPSTTAAYFESTKPDAAILAAARVGGIAANMSQPYDFLADNLKMQGNFLEAAHQAGVDRLIFLGSSCIYPRLSPQPIPETALMSGYLEPTNSAYAMAKLAGIEFVRSVRAQFGRSWISVIPSNLYGPGDNFSLTSSHVVPAIIRKAHEAKANSQSAMTLWGSGKVRREFLFSRDAAKGILFALTEYDEDLPLNIGCGEDITVQHLAQLIKSVVEYSGDIVWDSSMPDGIPRKLLDSSRIMTLGWHPQVDLREGLKQTYDWMLANFNKLRL